MPKGERMTDQQDAQIGKILGEYRLHRRLGGGTFGTVYQAKHLRKRSPAAVKVLQARLARHEDFKDFINEARMMRLHHPHIVRMLDFGVSKEDIPYLVMEYASGGTLRNCYPGGTKLALPTILAYTEQLAAALQYAHDQRIIHRDVKPENMLVRGDGTLLLSDFGIAKVLESSSLISLPTFLGTPAYMAPEQSFGNPCLASDQYALAVVLYEWITGRRPFQGSALEVILQHRLDQPPALTNLVPDLPPAVEQVVLKALMKDPAERFATVQEFAKVLRTAIQTASSIAKVAQAVSPPITQASEADSLVIEERSQQPGPLVSTVTGTAPARLPFLREPPPERVPSEMIGLIHRAAQQNQLPLATAVPLTPVVKRRRLPRRMLFLGMLAVVIVGASIAAPFKTFFTIHGRSQGLSMPNATATLQAASSATATAAAKAYNTAISRDGIQFGFDASHTGYNPYERQLLPITVQHLKQAWIASKDTYLDSQPAVANGLVYVNAGDRMDAFKADGCGQASCRPLWATVTSSLPSESSPAVANGVLYAYTGDGYLYVFHL
jgi:serine/threonine protein kinase